MSSAGLEGGKRLVLTSPALGSVPSSLHLSNTHGDESGSLLVQVWSKEQQVSIIQRLIGNRISDPTLDLLSQNPYFIKIPGGFLDTNFETRFSG